MRVVYIISPLACYTSAPRDEPSKKLSRAISNEEMAASRYSQRSQPRCLANISETECKLTSCPLRLFTQAYRRRVGRRRIAPSALHLRPIRSLLVSPTFRTYHPAWSTFTLSSEKIKKSVYFLYNKKKRITRRQMWITSGWLDVEKFSQKRYTGIGWRVDCGGDFTWW